ncbi:MAG: isopentenyl phosphate kinase [Desulfurococcaceae archaeon]
MKNLVFIKLGGSFITDKNKPISIKYEALRSTVDILREVVQDVKLIIGNGGGSFAHYVVMKYIDKNPAEFITLCHASTRALNKIIVDYLVMNNINATSIQTSAIISHSLSNDFKVFLEPIISLLNNNLIPVIYGDCIPSHQGYAIVSTEKVFEILSTYLRPSRIVLLTDVDGVYTCNPRSCREAKLINRITPKNIEEVLSILESDKNRDATGGMYSKIKLMFRISKTLEIPVIILSGFNITNVIRAIKGDLEITGTIITAK